MDSMDLDSNVGKSVKQTESCSYFLSNGIKGQLSKSSDTSDADGCQRKTRQPKLRRRPTGQVQVRLPSCTKHRYEEDGNLDDDSGDDRLLDLNKTISACSKIVSAADDGFASSNESENGLADLPHLYLPYINKATNDLLSPSSQDTENEQLSTFSLDSDYSDHREINAAVLNEEAEDQGHIYLESNSSSSNVEELDLCDDWSENDSSSDESDKDSSLSDDGSDCTNIFTKSIYEGSNLSVGASCIVIMQFSRKYKLPVKLRMIYPLH